MMSNEHNLGMVEGRWYYKYKVANEPFQTKLYDTKEQAISEGVKLENERAVLLSLLPELQENGTFEKELEVRQQPNQAAM
jgi:hypothetical protein